MQMASMGNSTFIFMSQTRLQNELIVFLGALRVLGKQPASQEIFPPAEPEIYGLLSLDLREALPHTLPLQPADVPKHFEFLANNERLILIYRIHQLLLLVQAAADKPDSWYFAVSPLWNHRWSDLVAGQVKQAQIDLLNADDFQP
jgi:hypothetical protein